MGPPAPTPGADPHAAARLAFARSATGDAHASIAAASADASARSYWRVHAVSGDAILMDASAVPEVIAPWLEVGARLRAAGLNAPKVLAEDGARGFLLLSDLGRRLYLDALNDATADALYADALDALAVMQTQVSAVGRPRFDAPFIVRELELLPTWFAQRHLGLAVTCADRDVIAGASRTLIANATRQPQVFMHRDYHSRNLLVVPGHGPGIIDFQDAVLGPVTYDVASLLRDCYIAWDAARVYAWAESHRRRLIDAGVLDARVTAAHWQRWFDLVGLQRHLKVLGIFCRLYYRDHKPEYLADLPRVWRYVRGVAACYPELRACLTLLERWVGNRDLTAPAT